MAGISQVTKRVRCDHISTLQQKEKFVGEFVTLALVSPAAREQHACCQVAQGRDRLYLCGSDVVAEGKWKKDQLRDILEQGDSKR